MPAGSDGADARQVAPATSNTNFTWTKDGRVIDDQNNALQWINVDSGAKGIFATEADTANGDPWECSDGRYIVFLHGLRSGQGSLNVWRADASGGNLKQLSSGRQDNYPVCAPDARSVYYLDGGSGKLMKLSIDGGAAQKLTDLLPEGFFDISPDGATAAFAMVDHLGEHKERLALVATDTGAIRKIVDLERLRFGLLRYTRDGKAVVYTTRENGVDNLWQQPLDGTPGKRMTSFKAEHIWDFHWSPDGSKLALSRGHSDSDVVLLRDMQP
jgi:Tol biopolymer transport system component